MLAHEWLRSHLRGPDALEPQRGPHLAVALAMKRTLLKDLTSVMHRLFIAAGAGRPGRGRTWLGLVAPSLLERDTCRNPAYPR